MINTNGQDALLLTGNSPTNGTWTMNFKMYIPSGKSGYFNIQGDDTPGNSFLSGDIYFNQDNNSPGEGTDSNGDFTFSFPHDSWFDVRVIVNMDDSAYTIEIRGDESNSNWTTSFNTDANSFSSLDFFFADSQNEYYIDAVQYVEGTLSTDDFETSIINVYPNPVVNTLYINSKEAVDHIAIYDITGKEILNKNISGSSPSIDVSHLKSGIFLATIRTGNKKETFKLVK